jgi:hypothetical protein
VRVKLSQELPRWRHLLMFCRELAKARGDAFDGVVAPLVEVEEALVRLEQELTP